MQKKLLIVMPYFVPAYSYGGPIKVAYDHAIGLQKKGYDVSVVTTDALDAHNRIKELDEIIHDIKIYRFRNFSNKLAKFHNIYLPRKMRSRLEKNIENYDIVHIHDTLNFPALWASKTAYKYKKPYFLHPHGILSDTRVAAKKSFLKKSFLKLFKSMLDHAAGIFALTAQEVTEIQKYTNNTNIHQLPNRINPQEFEKIPEIDLRKKYGLQEDTQIFSFLGRIQYIKGLDIAFKYLAEYNKTHTNRVYLIIGPDEGEQKKLMKLAEELGIAEKILRYGLATGVEKYSLLKASDVFLFTSRNEGFGLVILEAIYSGTPAIISDACPLPEVEETQCGSIIPQDTQNITDLIKYRSDQNFNIGEHDLDKLKAKFEKETILNQLDRYYHKQTNKKILLIHNLVTPTRTKLFNELFHKFKSQGHEFKILFTAETENNRKRDTSAEKAKFEFPYEILQSRQLSNNTKTDQHFFHINKDIITKLESEDPDIIIHAGWASLSARKSCRRANKNKKKFILWSGSTANEKSRRRTLTKPIVKRLVKHSHSYRSYGTRASRYLVSLGAQDKKIHKLYNTVDLEFFTEQGQKLKADKEQLKQDLNITERYVILFVGRLIQGKGIFELLEAFQNFQKKHDDFALVWVGSGPEEEQLKKIIQEKNIKSTYFMGYQQKPQVPKFFTIADIFTLPSYREVRGLVINEAMCFGLPILTSDQVGASEDLVTPEVGVISKVSAKSLEEGLETIIQKDLIHKNNSQKHIKKFTIESIIKDLHI